MSYYERNQRAYVEGNVVRQPQYLPDRRPYQPGKPLNSETLYERVVRGRRRRAIAMDFRYVFFLTIATIICMIFCAGYIHFREDVVSRTERIASLETEIASIKADNAAVEKRIEISKNLVEVKEEAAMLGLEYPSNSQIQYYTLDTDNYMNLYGEVE